MSLLAMDIFMVFFIMYSTGIMNYIFMADEYIIDKYNMVTE